MPYRTINESFLEKTATATLLTFASNVALSMLSVRFRNKK